MLKMEILVTKVEKFKLSTYICLTIGELVYVIEALKNLFIFYELLAQQ
jgi:hypothetical protein